MIKQFAFKEFAGDQEANDLVKGILDLARASYEADKKPADYDAKNKTVCESLALYALKYAPQFSTELEASDNKGATALALFNKSTVRNASVVRDMFNLVISQVITAITPEVTNEMFSRFIAEVHQVGFGDTARFIIKSNDLFAVREKAEGVRKGVDQPMYDNEITVHAHPVTID